MYLRTDLFRKLCVLPHWDTSCRSNLLSPLVTVYWHWGSLCRQLVQVHCIACSPCHMDIKPNMTMHVFSCVLAICRSTVHCLFYICVMLAQNLTWLNVSLCVLAACGNTVPQSVLGLCFVDTKPNMTMHVSWVLAACRSTAVHSLFYLCAMLVSKPNRANHVYVGSV